MPRMVAAQVMGRDGELEILTSLARDAASGRGRLVLIEGEPGIGKTSLLRALLCTVLTWPSVLNEAPWGAYGARSIKVQVGSLHRR